MKVAELPRPERPREKLMAQGARSLSDAELLAILLHTGSKNEPVLDLARRWLEEAGGLDRLVAADFDAILAQRGIGPAKGAALAAALELGRRVAWRCLEGQPVLDRPEAVAEFLLRSYGLDRVEVFGVLTLDARNRLVRNHELHRGTRSRADVEPAEIFKVAIAENAHGVIAWHTHPSGDPSPSDDDLDLTRRLAKAGTLLNIALLDHLIVARGGHVSLRRRGELS
jgi:DNA repair protein RadC